MAKHHVSNVDVTRQGLEQATSGDPAIALRHHDRHRYVNSEQDLGVSSPFWDLVVGTPGRRDRPT